MSRSVYKRSERAQENVEMYRRSGRAGRVMRELQLLIDAASDLMIVCKKHEQEIKWMRDLEQRPPAMTVPSDELNCQICSFSRRLNRGENPHRKAPTHGRATTYNQGCRCDLCRKANRERHLKRSWASKGFPDG